MLTPLLEAIMQCHVALHARRGFARPVCGFARQKVDILRRNPV
jgi:glutaredoxin-related protein